jgi:hypothetical protein
MQIAKIIKPDGSSEYIRPKNGEEFSLKELQAAVGGFIELVPLRTVNFYDEVMIVNENGKYQGLRLNQRATELAAIEETDFIVGNVLLLLSNWEPGL